MTNFLVHKSRPVLEAWCTQNIGPRFYADRHALQWDVAPVKGALYHIDQEQDGMQGDTWRVMIDDEMYAVLFQMRFEEAEPIE